MVEKYGPLYTPFALPKGTYQGLEQDVPGIGIGNILFVNEKMPEDVVYGLLTTLFDNLADVQTHPPRGQKARPGDRLGRLVDPVSPRRDQVLQREGRLG